MALIEIKDLKFSYPDQSKPALSSIHLTVRRGEFIVLCGPSGCGKTTLLRHLKAELQPVGHLTGEILFRGEPLLGHDPAALASQIGMVQQNPENQIVMENVLQELAFGLENMGMTTDVMRRRIAELVHFFGLESWLHKATRTLSGGQKQIVNLAALLLLQPDVLLLDEPTAQLDPVAAKEFLQMLRRLNEEFGLTVIVSEHRLEELFPMADRVVMLGRNGQIRYEGTPREVIGKVNRDGDSLYEQYLPSLARLYMSVEAAKGSAASSVDLSAGTAAADSGVRAEPSRLVPAAIPLHVKEGRAWLQSLKAAYGQSSKADGCRAESSLASFGATDGGIRSAVGASSKEANARIRMLECREVTFHYDRNVLPVLRQLDLNVEEGDFLAIVGSNGAGKSTLLKLMAGLEKPGRGEILLRGKPIRKIDREVRYREIGYLSQNPLAYFIEDTVGEELRRAADRSALEGRMERLDELMALLDLQPIAHMHPHDVSGGELQRAALACVLLAGPRLLLLDEPTKGLDPLLKQTWGELLTMLHHDGVTIVMVTHDIEFAAVYAGTCAMLFDGEIASMGVTERFFAGNHFYTTVINRVVRDEYPYAVTFREVQNRCLELVSPS